MQLDPKEMEALLKEDQGERNQAETQSVSAAVREYDLCNPQALSKAERAKIEVCLGNFTRPLKAVLDTHLAKSMTVEPLDMDVTTLGELLTTRPANSHVTKFRVGTGAFPAEVVWEGGFLFYVVDRLMGGAGSAEEKFFPTPIARRIADLLVASLFESLNEAFVRLQELQARWPTQEDLERTKREGLEDSIQYLRVGWGVEGGGCNARLEFLFPADDLRTRDDSEAQDPDQKIGREEALEGCARMAAIPLQLVVRLGNGMVSGADLLELKAGDVFLLDRSVGDPVDVAIEGQVLHKAALGTDGKKVAIRIKKVEEESPEAGGQASVEGL